MFFWHCAAQFYLPEGAQSEQLAVHSTDIQALFPAWHSPFLAQNVQQLSSPHASLCLSPQPEFSA
jgi:hypothetical protein